jgi:hypothetical protein
MKKALGCFSFLGRLLAGIVLLDPRLSVTLGGVSLVLGLAVWGGNAVTRSVGADPAFSVAKAPLSLAALPPYLDPGILGDLHRRHLASLPTRLTDADAAGTLGRALAASPWVREVLSVDLDATPQIRLDIVFREPAAAVPWGRGIGTVDQDGVLLPRQFYRPEALARPAMLGVRGAPPRQAGLIWKDPGLQAGLEILRRFRDAPTVRGNPAASLESIDVSNVGERQADLPEVVCLTRRHLRLNFSVSGRMGRPTLEEQLARFRQVLLIDRDLAMARRYVDLRFDRPVGS